MVIDASEEQDASASIDCGAMSEGTVCGADRICIGSACVRSRCGDGFVDSRLGERCDDGNMDAGDGCESTCEFTCSVDDDCVGEDACEIGGHCDEAHVCTPSTSLNCDDGDPCTVDSCAAATGCASHSLDADGDGYLAAPPPDGCALPAGDCNDGDPEVYPGADERCDLGDPVDDDCDGEVSDSPLPRAWFADCDGDGVAGSDTATSLLCDPPPAPAGCVGWTDLGAAVALDCDDDNPSVFPGQTESFTEPTSDGSWDYDCDGAATSPDRCGGRCLINATLGRCDRFDGPYCTGPCGSTGQRVISCSDAYRCNNEYYRFTISCR